MHIVPLMGVIVLLDIEHSIDYPLGSRARIQKMNDDGSLTLPLGLYCK
jgi:hypothetical protein